MKMVIAGGSGQIGQMLRRTWCRQHQVVVLSRRPQSADELLWDGSNVGEWSRALEGADVVLNLAGRSVDCRYTEGNLQAMLASRVDSTRAIGEAIESCTQPPRLWLQMSTATIYAHSFERANDEFTGEIGGKEPDAPEYWRRSIEIAEAWEQILAQAQTPHTRKVALRTAMVMSPDKGGVFDVLYKLARLGFGGRVGDGRQFVSWIHEKDFVEALEFIIAHPELSGPINLAAPGPLPQAQFNQSLREHLGVRLGLPTTRWMAEIGAFFLRTDTELLLKSRRVIPGILQKAGFEFNYPSWPQAAEDLVTRRLKGPLAPVPTDVQPVA